MRAAAETGAYATVWSVLEVALPGLLRDTPIRGAAGLLSLALECASRYGAKREIAEVAAVATRTGSSQVVKNARLLRDVLPETARGRLGVSFQVSPTQYPARRAAREWTGVSRACQKPCAPVHPSGDQAGGDVSSNSQVNPVRA